MLKYAAAVILALATVTSAQAAFLYDLINLNQSIVYNGLVFDQFSYISNNDMPDSKLITVNTTDDAYGSGLLFQGSFLDLPGGQTSSAVIGFRVTSLGQPITGAGMTGNPNVVAGGGAISVTDTYLPQDNAAQLSIFKTVPGGLQLTDSLSFAQSHQSLNVQKGILAVSTGGLPTMTFVTQTFAVVPEPASALMAGMALCGLAVVVRRKRS